MEYKNMEYKLTGTLKSVDSKQICVIGNEDTIKKLNNIKATGTANIANIKIYGNLFYVKCNGDTIPPGYEGKAIKIRVALKKYSFNLITGCYMRLLSIELV